MTWDATTTAAVVTAACTAAAAVATAFMAVFTGIAIKSGQRQFRDAQARSEEHHRDAFRPVVVLSPFEGIEPEDRSNVIQFDAAAGSDERRFVRIAAILRNVGAGPALKVRLLFRAMSKPGYGFALALAPIGASEKYDLASRNVRYPVQPTSGFNAADIAFASGTGWELVIEYEDVFGNPFHTIHRKNPQMPWTECGKGPAPGITHQGVTPSE